jgi:hypothetical protein
VRCLKGCDVPIKFRISPDLDLVYTAWWGDVSIAEWRQVFSRYLKDPHYRPGRTELTDLSGVGRIDATFNSIWSALNMVNAQLPGEAARTQTLLVTPGEVAFGLARMYQTLAENANGIKVEIYRTPEAALRALNLDYGSVEELLENGGFLPFAPADAPSDGA